jgi:hypothetical protein
MLSWLSVSTLSHWIHGKGETEKLHLADVDEKSRLIQTSESLAGIFVAILLYMASHIEQIAFQR